MPETETLTRADLLREEALVRAREVCCGSHLNQEVDEKMIVSYAEAFFAFLKG